MRTIRGPNMFVTHVLYLPLLTYNLIVNMTDDNSSTKRELQDTGDKGITYKPLLDDTDV